MASSKKKALWSTEAFKSRTTAERKASRAENKAWLKNFYNRPEQVAAAAKNKAYHAAWVAAGMPLSHADWVASGMPMPDKTKGE